MPIHTRVLAVIPARYGSTRLPGKPLALIDGKPMIQHVWERCQECPSVHQTIVATDDERIVASVQAFGGEARMTRVDHASGSDRVWEVAQAFPDEDIILNVQGDEPYLPSGYLTAAIEVLLTEPKAQIATLVTPIQTLQGKIDETQFSDPNVVKAVLASNGKVLYFSRAPIPHARDGWDHAPVDTAGEPFVPYRHLGLYAFRYEALKTFTQLPPSPLEQVEKLEQLRALEAGLRIDAAVVIKAPLSVDTPEDLDRLQAVLSVKN